MTPSAVSHQIKLLEEQVGIRLFHRIHRSVVLTDAGRRYAEEIALAFSRIEAATKNIAQTGKSDILTIHSTPSFATQWLMPRLSRFTARNPDIDVRLNASVSNIDLSAGVVDIDIRYARTLAPVGVVLRPLPQETVVPMCAPELANGVRPIRTPKDLRHHMLIHSEACLVGWRDWLRRNRSVTLDLGRGLRFDRSFMAIGAAVDGLGVCLDSLLLAQREIETGRLVMPLGPNALQLQGHNLVFLKSCADLPKIVAFQDWLFSELTLTKQWEQRMLESMKNR